MKQLTPSDLRAHFLEQVLEWNKIHRIIGSEPEKLLSQSEKAIDSFVRSGGADFNSVWVDVGAGSGVALIPMLWLFPETRLAFVEPDRKKIGFLEHFLSGVSLRVPPVLVCSKIQFVSRETLASDEAGLLFFARAFSGDLDLVKCVRRSQFRASKWYVFKAESENYFFSPLKI